MLTISNAISNTVLRSALIPFITAGYPSLDTTAQVLALLDSQGVQAIELGIPYSDALADGNVIQESSRIALQKKAYVNQVLELVSSLSHQINAPIIIFTYLNPVLAKGIELFVKQIAQAGVKGLVIPDLPLEESDYCIAVCNYYEIELILFVSPSSSQERINQIIEKAPGCIYLVSSYGVTGQREHIDSNTRHLVKRIKLASDKAVMLGFGISNEFQVKKIMNSNLGVDAIVMGTAFINQIKYSYDHNAYSNIGLFCDRLKNAMLDV